MAIGGSSCKTRGKLKEKEAIMLVDREGRDIEKLWLLEKSTGGQWIAHPDSDSSLEDVLARVGRMPLPHYIRDGQMVDQDIENYQTVFAKNPGAVAAPTAGLHFTEKIDPRSGKPWYRFLNLDASRWFRHISTNSR